MTARLCGAKKHQGEGTCSKPAGWGTDHVGEGSCKLHGGCTPTGSKGAKLRLLEREARELFGKIAPEVAPVDNPLAAYAELAARVLAWMQLMDSLLEGLRDVGYSSEYAGEQVYAVVQLYERAMDRANTVLGSYARLRIDERLAQITERQKMTVIRAIDAALDEIGIAPEARQSARQEVARQLRLVHSA
jgi:hypothetical protein